MTTENAGPLETVSHKGSTVFIYQTPTTKNGKTYNGHTLIYTESGKRKRRYVAKLTKARATAKTIAQQLSEGTGHVQALSPSEIADYIAAVKILRQHPDYSLASVCQQFSEAMLQLGSHGTIRDAVSTHVRTSTSAKIPEIKVDVLVSRFIEEKGKEGLSDFYLVDIENKLNRFASAFRCHISSIQPEEISSWLSSQATGRNANNLRSAVATLFSFARDNGFLPREQFHAAKLVKKKKEKSPPIGIYTPDEIRKILAVADKRFIPTLAIAAFAGLRSSEIFRLDWSDVKIDRGHISLDANKTKTATRRIVPILPVLAAWLEDHRKDSGRICPDYARLNNLTRQYAALCKTTGVTVQRNGFRHSYASYRLAIVESADKVALELGNSPRKLFTNYRELVTKEEAEEWFCSHSSLLKPPTPSPRSKKSRSQSGAPKTAQSPKRKAKPPIAKKKG